jgi:lipopolysaccharide heptosyltransferase II
MRGMHWTSATNVLAVRLDGLGDLLMTAPALISLKQGLPGRTLTLLTSPAASEAARLIRGIDRVMTYAAPWMKATPPRDDAAQERAMIERLRREAFDGAVIFTIFSQSPLPAAFMCRLAEIPLRAAYCRENPYQMLTDWLTESDSADQARHELQRQLDLVGALGCRTDRPASLLEIPPATRHAVARRLAALSLDPHRPWLVLHPGATAPSRRYAPAKFAAAGRELVARYGFQLFVTGNSIERSLAASITENVGGDAINLAGTLSLAELAALLQLAPLLVSNNTGPVHLASAVGTPVVDLYALTNPQHTPWGVPHRVLFHDVPCRNCFKSICPLGHHDCLAQVPPAAVVEAVVELYEACGYDGPHGVAESESASL